MIQLLSSITFNFNTIVGLSKRKSGLLTSLFSKNTNVTLPHIHVDLELTSKSINP